MIGKLEEGRTITSVAAEFGINKSVISRAWEAFRTTGTTVRKVGGGRPRTTTAGYGRYIILQGGIMLNGRNELHIFDRGTVIGNRYCEEVLLPHVRLFLGANGPDFIFMDDNAQPHRSLAVQELLESEDITRMDWSAYSPDLNPIEHV
ncbi:transposable element Tcb2 transposase [Trichonephila clavipes]|nr:transposable element Tcb2 transposase [Trichonephila clavipes]